MKKQETTKENVFQKMEDELLKKGEEKIVTKAEEQLKKDLEEKQKIIDDYENTLKRLQADFENFMKRTQKEKEDFAMYSAARVLAKLLNIIDDFERTIKLLEKTDNAELKTGIEMIHRQFHKILEEEGIKQMQCRGRKTDPYCHEVVDMVEHETPEGIIVDELQKGYYIHDRVLRPARVRVSKGSAQTEMSKSAEKRGTAQSSESQKEKQ